MKPKPKKAKKYHPPHIEKLIQESIDNQTCKCGGKHFTLYIENHDLIRKCKSCKSTQTF